MKMVQQDPAEIIIPLPDKYKAASGKKYTARANHPDNDG